MTVVFCASYNSLICFHLAWPFLGPLVLLLVRWVLFLQIWGRSYFSTQVYIVGSPQNHFSKVLVVSFHPFSEAYFSGCLWKLALRVVLHMRSG